MSLLSMLTFNLLKFIIIFKGAVCRIELGIAVQIQNIGDKILETPTETSSHDDEWN